MRPTALKSFRALFTLARLLRPCRVRQQVFLVFPLSRSLTVSWSLGTRRGLIFGFVFAMAGGHRYVSCLYGAAFSFRAASITESGACSLRVVFFTKVFACAEGAS